MALDADRVKSEASIEKVIGNYVELKKQGSEFFGLCPFHTERTPSFSVTPAKRLYFCFGCDATGNVFQFVQKIEGVTFQDAVRIVAELSGIPVDDVRGSERNSNAVCRSRFIDKTRTEEESEPEAKPELVAKYDYVDEQANLLYQALRYEPGRDGKKKEFRQRCPHPDGNGWIWGLGGGWYRQGASGDWFSVKDYDPGRDIELLQVRRVLWRLPKVLKAQEVIVVEGEKDVLTLEGFGFVATTISGGAKKPWEDSYTEALRGKRVILIPDTDAPGQALGRRIEAALNGIAAEVVYVRLPAGFKDITDYVEAGHDLGSILALIESVARERDEADRRRRGLLSWTEILNRQQDGMAAFHDPSRRPKGLQTGFHQFDDMTLGLRGGELFVLAARPAFGKTMLALNIAANIASRDVGAVAIFSLEMSSESLLERMVCARAGIDSLKFRSGYASDAEKQRFFRASSELSRHPIFVDDYPPHTVEDIRRKLALLREQETIALVVIDYLQLMTPSKAAKSYASKVIEVGEQTRGLKLLARE